MQCTKNLKNIVDEFSCFCPRVYPRLRACYPAHYGPGRQALILPHRRAQQEDRRDRQALFDRETSRVKRPNLATSPFRDAGVSLLIKIDPLPGSKIED